MNNDDIKRLRVALGWSQERLAREVGVSFCTVNRWERGKSKPSPMASNILKRLKEKSGAGNKREAVRLDLQYPIDIESVGAAVVSPDARLYHSYTDNVSSGGLCFKAPAGVQPGELLRIYLNIGDSDPVEALSEVVWTSDNGGDKRAGVRFQKVVQEDMTRLMNAMLMN